MRSSPHSAHFDRFDLTGADIAILQSVSTVFYRDAEWFPASRRRSEFDSGARWAKGLPVCGAA